MKAEGMCRTGCGHYAPDPGLLAGLLATDADVPEDAPRLAIPHPRCAACAARGTRCFHDQLQYPKPAEEIEER